MTNEERLAKAQAVIAKARTHTVTACISCRHLRNGGWSWAKCQSPIATLMRQADNVTGAGAWPEAKKMRSPDGLCGPDAMLFEQRPLHHLLPWQQPNDSRMFLSIVGTIIVTTALFILSLALLVR